MSWLKELFCKHKWKYSDDLFFRDCVKCGKSQSWVTILGSGEYC